jgi:hypothetical protein
MSFRLIKLAAALEESDELHEARVLVLLHVVAPASTSAPVAGIMKLAKMDFLLRYPNILARALEGVSSEKTSASKLAHKIPEEQRHTIEGRMIRFRFGPWDARYRRWLAILSSRGLVMVSRQGQTVRISLTEKGSLFARRLAEQPDYVDLVERAKMVRLAVGDMSATRLKDFVYKIAPEIVNMKWGESIAL